ncbi:MAG: lipopolysaccharide assembly protein LapA domain-containing protein [Spirochaetales bacterium]|nr:lipopolysaccharide assembly protein LapA domain-containing protein [Spirochaetales bacterium]
MPWRMIVFLIILAVLAVFAGLNIGNASDISFGFVVLEQVPVFLTIFLSFILGALFMFPFTLGVRRRKKDKISAKKKSIKGSPSADSEKSSSQAVESSKKDSRKEKKRSSQSEEKPKKSSSSGNSGDQ